MFSNFSFVILFYFLIFYYLFKKLQINSQTNQKKTKTKNMLATSSRLFSTFAPRAMAAMTAAKPKPLILNETDITQYHQNGFLVLPNLLSQSEKEKVFEWTEQISKLPETPGKWMQYFEKKNGQRILCRTENFLEYFPEFDKLIRGKITNAVTDLLGEPALLYKEKINFKLPNSSGFAPHQDAPAYVTFKQRLHLTAMVAADQATYENGCLEVVRGEHTKGYFPHPGGVMEEATVKQWEKEGRWEPVFMEPGSILLFGSFIPHRSGDNKSSKSRRAYYLTYNALSDGDFRQAYYEDKRKHFPPDAERIPGKDYSEGAKIYNLANPISTKG